MQERKKKNMNGKIGVNKSKNFALVVDAFTKQFQNCGSTNHLTHLCKKAISEPKGKVKKVIWIIESGCSRHMTADKALLSQFNEMAGPLVTFGDKQQRIHNGIWQAFIEQSKMWHKKLSHLNYKAINILVKKELVRDMPNLEFAQDEVYEACQKGKIKRKKYALVMVDDYSRYIWVEFIHSKDATPHMIIEHINKIEKQAEDQNYVKRLRSDNVTKFRNAILTEFCKEKGIVQEFSAARTPQQNGEVERKNRTLVEAARTMLQDAKFANKKIMESKDVTFDDDKYPGMECFYENEAKALKFENLNIDSDSEDEADINTNNIMNVESTEQDESSASHSNDEENAENSSQQNHTRKWDRSRTRDAIIGDPNAGVRTRSHYAISGLRSPATSRIRSKMLYATSKERFRREMDGVHYEIQATDPLEMDLEVLKDRANWNLLGKMLFFLGK
ncbi:hypothetical protein AgCh_033861 [Apium graveolens]